MFLHLPKTGGWSVKKALKQASPVSYCLRHRGKAKKPLPVRMSLCSGNYPNLKVFTVMRNPFTRAVSAYNYLKYGAQRHRERDRLDYQSYLSNFENFEDFVISGGLNDVANSLVHFRPQSFWMRETNTPIGNRWVVCENVRIFKFEKMNKSVPRYLKKQTGESVTLEKLNETRPAPSITFSKQLKKEVCSVYEQDFEIWKSL